MSGVAGSEFATIAAANGDSKGLLSEFGWVFLINDTNDFLSLMCGTGLWDDEDRARASSVMQQRISLLAQMGIAYRKFIIPEKSVIYSEYLPVKLQSNLVESARPAQILETDHPSAVFYLDKYLADSKPLGLIYFRADTHPNWLGAWLVYRAVAERLMADGLLEGQGAIPLSHLSGSLASYDGDLITQVPAAQRTAFDAKLGHAVPMFGFEMTIKLDLLPDRRVAFRVETPDDYAVWYNTRETIVYERPDGVGPRAVIFRDSTFDRGVVDLLAQHFSRSVFVWHQGIVDLRVIERERPALVVHAMAERFVTRYPQIAPYVRVCET